MISAAPAAPVVTGVIERDVAISRDGQTIVYQSAISPSQLSVRPLDQLESLPLTGPDDAIGPFFSPDGRWVGFQAGATGPLQRVSIQGGPPQTIVDPPVNLTGASWGPDDVLVYSVNSVEGLYQVPAAGGEAKALTETNNLSADQHPDVLPNGAGVLVTVSSRPGAGDNQIAVLDLRTDERRVIIPSGSSPQYATSGHIVYALGSTLMAVPFDPDRLEVMGEPVPAVEGVLVKNDGLADFSLSETGSLVYVTGSLFGNALTAVWVDQEGREEPLPLPARTYQSPRLSPDGKRLAVGVTGDDGTIALWVFDVASAAGLRLTQEGSVLTPIWLSDDRLAFATNVEGGQYEIYTVMADGSSPPERLLSSEGIDNGGINGDYPTSVKPDGASLIYSHLITLAHREIFEVPLQGDLTPRPILQGEFNRGNGEVSPDGRWLVYRSDQSGDMEVYVQPYPGPGPTVPVSIGGGTSVTWSPDGTKLVYRLDDRMMAVSFDASSGTPRIGRPRELFRGSYFAPALGGARQYHIAPDGRFLLLKTASSGEGGELPPQVILVQNFFEELKRLAPN